MKGMNNICSPSRWDRYLGMTAAMTQVSVLYGYGYLLNPVEVHRIQKIEFVF